MSYPKNWLQMDEIIGYSPSVKKVIDDFGLSIAKDRTIGTSLLLGRDPRLCVHALFLQRYKEPSFEERYFNVVHR